MDRTTRDELRKGICYFVASFLNMAIALMMLPVITRWLTTEDYGVMALGSVVAIGFMGLVNLGINAGFERNFFQYEFDRQKLGKLVHSSLGFILCGTLLWGMALYTFKDTLSFYLLGDERWGAEIWIICLTSALSLLTNMQLVYFRNQGKALEFTIYSVVSAVAENAIVLLLVVGAGLGLMGVVLGYCLGKLLVLTVLWTRMMTEIPVGLDLSIIRELFGIGLPLTPRVAMSIVENGADRLLIRWLSSLGQVGVFGLANQIGQGVFKTLTSIQNVYSPQVYRLMFEAGEGGGGSRVGQYLTPYFYVSMLVPVSVILFADEVLWFLVAPTFYEARYVVVVLAAYYGQMFFGKIVGAQLLYKKRMWYTSAFSLINLLLHIGLSFLLIAKYGALGAAFALFISGVITQAFSLWVAQREYRIVYELWFVLPVMGLFYLSMFWCLLPNVLYLSRGVTLAGKLMLLTLFLAVGFRWVQFAKSYLARLITDTKTLAVR